MASPIVLDMTAGGRMMWPDKANPLALFLDKRYETVEMLDRGNVRELDISPDVVADWSEGTLPFMNDSFDQIIFDPPHLLKAGKNSWLQKKYGVLNESTWKSDLTNGFSEAARMLKQGGTLAFKWNSDQIPLKDVLALVPNELTQTIQNRVNKTYICLFIKIKESNHE